MTDHKGYARLNPAAFEDIGHGHSMRFGLNLLLPESMDRIVQLSSSSRKRVTGGREQLQRNIESDVGDGGDQED